MTKYLSPRDIDWTVLLIVLLICAVGVLQIYSATLRHGLHLSAWWKQIVYVAGGLVLMWLAMAVDYHTHAALCAGALYRHRAGAVGHVFDWRANVRVAALDSDLDSGIHLQVSEFVKLVIILLVARYLTDLKTDELEIREMLKSGGSGGGSHRAGPEAAGPGDGAYVSRSSGCGSVSGGFALEVCGRHRSCDDAWCFPSVGSF